jgi:hypothetical protein
MKILTIKENKSIGIKPEKIYQQITTGLSKLNVKKSQYEDTIILEDK